MATSLCNLINTNLRYQLAFLNISDRPKENKLNAANIDIELWTTRDVKFLMFYIV